MHLKKKKTFGSNSFYLEKSEKSQINNLSTGFLCADTNYASSLNWPFLTHEEFMSHPDNIKKVTEKFIHSALNNNSNSSGYFDISYTTNVKSLEYYAKKSALSYFQDNSQEITPRLLGLTQSIPCASSELSSSSPISWDNLWRYVWNMLLIQGKDSFHLFQLFATAFSEEPTFVCHDKFTYSEDYAHGDLLYRSLVSKRQKYLSSRLFIGKFNHRFEHLAYNTDLKKLAQLINYQKFEHIVLLDLSYSQLDRSDYLGLTALKSLVGLDVTGCSKGLDQNILFSWVIAMRKQWINSSGPNSTKNETSNSDIWPNLRILCLGDNSKLGIKPLEELFQTCHNLTYLEIDDIYIHGFKSQVKELIGLSDPKDILNNNPVWATRPKLYERLRIFDRLNEIGDNSKKDMTLKLSDKLALEPHSSINFKKYKRKHGSCDGISETCLAANLMEDKGFRDHGLKLGGIYFTINNLYKKIIQSRFDQNLDLGCFTKPLESKKRFCNPEINRNSHRNDINRNTECNPEKRTYGIMVNPGFGIKSISQGTGCIVQEIELASGPPSLENGIFRYGSNAKDSCKNLPQYLKPDFRKNETPFLSATKSFNSTNDYSNNFENNSDHKIKKNIGNDFLADPKISLWETRKIPKLNIERDFYLNHKNESKIYEFFRIRHGTEKIKGSLSCDDCNDTDTSNITGIYPGKFFGDISFNNFNKKEESDLIGKGKTKIHSCHYSLNQNHSGLEGVTQISSLPVIIESPIKLPRKKSISTSLKNITRVSKPVSTVNSQRKPKVDPQIFLGFKKSSK